MTSVTEEMIEAAAIAIGRGLGFNPVGAAFIEHRGIARAALEAALSASPAAQAGDWVLVPRKPTEAMHMAGIEVMAADLRDGEVPVVPRIYGAMIAAGGWGYAGPLNSFAPAIRREVRPDLVLVMDEKTGEALPMARPRYDLNELLNGHDPATNHGEVWSEPAAPSAPQPTEPVAGILGAQDLASAAASLLEVFADQFKASDDTASWSMASVMAEKIRAALVSPVAQQRDEGWQDIATAPPAMHVMACRFDHDLGEWVYAVVMSPPIYPFTHWRQLPQPPALSPERKDQSNG